MRSFKGKTLQQVWPRMIRAIMKNGRTVVDQRGSETKELTDLVWTIEEPEKSKIPKGSPFGPKCTEQYKGQLLDPDKKGFVYTYGNRLRRFTVMKPEIPVEKNEKLKNIQKISEIALKARIFYIDQIKKAIKDLKECPTTRRAIAVTWQLPEDFVEDEVPCLIMVDFLIRNNKLQTSAVWRSHDLCGASAPNFFALMELSKFVANELDIELGPITIHSMAAHIYSYNFEEMEKV